jgi:putative transposase
MKHILYRRHRFPPIIIQHAVWLYFRFSLSYQDVEDLLAERGIVVSYETIRRWANKFGRQYAKQLRLRRPKPSSTWYIDEVFLKISGKQFYL